MSSSTPIRTVLFDLDGTLLDTAPDLAYALNCVLQEQGREPLPFEVIRPVVSHGAIAITRLGFGLEPEHPDFAPLRERLLEIYRDNIARETRLFPGMGDLLDTLESQGMNWGVVTNKPSRFTEPLMAALDLSARAACIVSGDTCNNSKPHPEPILYGCELAGSSAPQCLYVGDAERDIEAGRRAGLRTVVALFGYIGDNDTPQNWAADAMLDTPQQISEWILTNNTST